jgi:hypothetical protein
MVKLALPRGLRELRVQARTGYCTISVIYGSMARAAILFLEMFELQPFARQCAGFGTSLPGLHCLKRSAESHRRGSDSWVDHSTRNRVT